MSTIFNTNRRGSGKLPADQRYMLQREVKERYRRGKSDDDIKREIDEGGKCPFPFTTGHVKYCRYRMGLKDWNRRRRRRRNVSAVNGVETTSPSIPSLAKNYAKIREDVNAFGASLEAVIRNIKKLV